MNTFTPIYVEIQNFLRLGIEKGRFCEGDRLPSEQDLAQRFGTTRTTVAKALQQLVFERVITRRAGSGTFVSASRIEDAVDTSVLESFEDHILAMGESLAYELIVWQSEPASVETARSLGLGPQASVFRLERLRYIGQRKVALEIRFLPSSIGKGIDINWLKVKSVQGVLRDDLGLAISRIDNTVSAATASAALAKVLDISRGDALLVRKHTIFDARGRVLLCGQALYPGDFSVRYTLDPTQRLTRAR